MFVCQSKECPVFSSWSERRRLISLRQAEALALAAQLEARAKQIRACLQCRRLKRLGSVPGNGGV